jgi:hypothetical protein
LLEALDPDLRPNPLEPFFDLVPLDLEPDCCLAMLSLSS